MECACPRIIRRFILYYYFPVLYKLENYVWKWKTQTLLKIIKKQKNKKQNEIIKIETHGTDSKNGWNFMLQIDDNDEFVMFITNINFPLSVSSIFELNIEMEIKIDDNAWPLARTTRKYSYDDGTDSRRTAFRTGIIIKAIENYFKLGRKRIKMNININIKNIYDKNGNEIIKGNDIGFYDNKNDETFITTFFEGK